MLASGLFGYPADYAIWWLLTLSVLLHTWCFFRFFPRRKYRRTGLVFGNVLVFLSMLAMIALGGESYYRFLCMETDPFGLSLPAQRWFALHVRLNEWGCRDVEWATPKPAGTYRIAFVGDSFTYGWGVAKVGDRFTERIAAHFAAEDRSAVSDGATGAPRPRVDVLNVAKPGWGTGDQIQPVKDIVDVLGVDEIVLCYVPNDIEKLIPREGDFDPVRPPIPTWINPTSSALVDFLYYRVFVPRVRTVFRYHDWLAEGFADAEIWRRHQSQLYALIAFAKEKGVTFRVVLLPFLRTGGEKFQPARLHDTLRRFFEANDVPVADMLPVIESQDPAALTVSGWDAHPNATAHVLFAEAIWKQFYRGP